MICEKCNYDSSDEKRIPKKFGVVFCNVCFAFVPNTPEDVDRFTEDKIPKENLPTLDYFRPFAKNRSDHLKKGMVKKAIKGNTMSRAPFGYVIENKKLIPAPNYKEVEEIFEEFLEEGIKLRQLSRKHNLSVNGLKKILRNFTYIGKIKFNNQIYNGNHKPIISSTLFNHVQNKIEKLGLK